MGDQSNPAKTPCFSRYIGIDYSGAARPETGLAGIRVYVAERGQQPVEVRPKLDQRRHWSRAGLACWLQQRLAEPVVTIVGIDHGLGFPQAYFDQYGLDCDWSGFLADFVAHWPTDANGVLVEDVRQQRVGAGWLRCGDSRWRREAERRVRAKSVFHFDVPGSVAKSTPAGLPWLYRLHRELPALHFWPFAGWRAPVGVSVLAEVYPAMFSGQYPRGDRSGDQQDAFAIAAWLEAQDQAGQLAAHLNPELPVSTRTAARKEGWILGVR